MTIDALGTLEYDVDEDGHPRLPVKLEHKLQWSLIDIERAGGLTGWAAKHLLSAGDWIDKEVEERRRTVGGIDNMWFLLSEVTDFNPVCACTYTLRGKFTIEKLRDAAARQSERFPKYRQRIISVGRRFHGARFEDDPHFDLNNHIRTVRLPKPAGKKELDDLMGKFIAQSWDLNRPLWEMVLVTNYHDHEGARSAVITRGHHALADGQGFVISQLYITSYHDELVKTMNMSSKKLEDIKHGKLLPSKIHRSLRPLDSLSENPWTSPLLQTVLALSFWLAYTVSLGISLFWSIYQAFHQAALFLLTCWRVDTLTGPQPGARVPEREFASSRVFRLTDVKACQQAFSGARPGAAVAGVPADQRDSAQSKAGHVTLNDVVCAVMADVLAQELTARPADQLQGPWERVKRRLRTVLPSPMGFFIPISVRKPGDWSMRNLSTGSIVFLNPSRDLSPDVSARELHAHIHRCRAELSLLKHSIWPRLNFFALQLTGQAPALFRASLLANSSRWIKEWITEHITKPLYDLGLQSVPVILTNVPGPAKKTITLEGIEVIKWTALPPQAGKGTIGMGIISYAGGISIAVAADKVPSSEGVARRICEKFEARFELYARRAKEVLDHLD
ncbi:hypothetical protein WOLCODRAFT_164912 [Wolfiporia cocos MD-104 SS10]|uniref:Uncharacterized protein n=1 Tax=Wolfiporia cocos (strain MD-104) TaxID=742152 RepID=A0A2H3JPI8_WOLCO|nr:hypothetical protein WOLCODRAFT_164912 [Wolfiporia cocos MD-104 SS10]